MGRHQKYGLKRTEFFEKKIGLKELNFGKI